MTRAFKLIDVFGTVPFSGNPLAVISDGDDLSTEEMQRIANWLNLSETTFLLAPIHPDADYRVRIFTRTRELPFAGHPTLGSCHAWREAGGTTKRAGVVVQECGVGLVTVRTRADGLAFAAPPLLRSGPPSEREITDAAAVLQIDRAAILDASWADNGPGWIALLLASAEAVLAVEPAPSHHGRVSIGIVGAHPPGGEAAFELRALSSAPGGGLNEDPATGSLNAAVGQWLFASGRARQRYIAAQGTRLGRTGRILVEQDDAGQVWVGGKTLTLFSGGS